MGTKVSVIMPTHNDAAYISFAINSVRAQTFQDWELIIMDDGSRDDTAKIAEDYAARDSRIRVMRQKNSGVVAARNNAIKAARGEYIFPLDADDRITPRCLEKLYLAIDGSDFGVVSPRFAFYEGANGASHTEQPTAREMCLGNKIVNSSIFRKSDWEKYGGYDPKFNIGWEDYDFWMNFVNDGKKIFLAKDILFLYRIKPKPLSRNSQADAHRKELNKLLTVKYPKIRFYRRLRFILQFKKTSGAFIVRFMKIPVFFIPRLVFGGPAKVCFFNEVPNFGDMLNIAVLRDIFGKEIKNAPPKRTGAVFIGSMLQLFLRRRLNPARLVAKFLRPPVVVWGAGFIGPEKYGARKLLRRMDIRALRGKLSLKRMRGYTKKPLLGAALGDPGLLAARLIDADKIEKKYDLGIIPHYVDQDSGLLGKIKVKNSVIINPLMPTYDFLEMVASCRNIMSSAMHGLIAADSLGIPNVRMIVSDNIEGGDYKFNDYYSAFGLDSHRKIDLRKIKEFHNTAFIKSHYKIKKEKVDKVCEGLIKAFPYENGMD